MWVGTIYWSRRNVNGPNKMKRKIDDFLSTNFAMACHDDDDSYK